MIADALKRWTERMLGSELKSRLATPTRTTNEYGVDPFGFDVDFTVAAMAPFLWLYKKYFRVKTFDLANVPAGRVLLVSNHSGQIPLDAAMIGVALLAEADPPRAVRSMVEKWVPTLPYVSTFLARVGQIVGTPENCRRLLNSDEAILVFPEGVRALSKLWVDRYRVQPLGLGFMRLALETRTPIVPVAVIGAEEQAPALFNFKLVAKLFGFPSFPITPTVLPWPLPTKYRIYFGEPIRFTGRPDEDDEELDAKVEKVRLVLQGMIDQGVAQREHVFW